MFEIIRSGIVRAGEKTDGLAVRRQSGPWPSGAVSVVGRWDLRPLSWRGDRGLQSSEKTE